MAMLAGTCIVEAEAAAEIYPSDVGNDADDVYDDVDDDTSCLGVRRRCLVHSAECNRALNDHRRYCRESTKILYCSAVEWFVNRFTQPYRCENYFRFRFWFNRHVSCSVHRLGHVWANYYIDLYCPRITYLLTYFLTL